MAIAFFLDSSMCYFHMLLEKHWISYPMSLYHHLLNWKLIYEYSLPLWLKILNFLHHLEYCQHQKLSIASACLHVINIFQINCSSHALVWISTAVYPLYTVNWFGKLDIISPQNSKCPSRESELSFVVMFYFEVSINWVSPHAEIEWNSFRSTYHIHMNARWFSDSSCPIALVLLHWMLNGFLMIGHSKENVSDPFKVGIKLHRQIGNCGVRGLMLVSRKTNNIKHYPEHRGVDYWKT